LSDNEREREGEREREIGREIAPTSVLSTNIRQETEAIYGNRPRQYTTERDSQKIKLKIKSQKEKKVIL
jgi:hypothetical protein